MRATNLFLASGVLLVSASQAQAQHGAHHCDPDAVAEPVLSTPDFDGDGVVTTSDIVELGQQVDSGVYTAFFDVNADGKLTGRDVSQAALREGETSSELDQQLAEVFWATERYRDVDNAIADGFRPYTNTFAGHGMHYTRLPIKATKPLIDPYTGVVHDPIDPDDVRIDLSYENVQDAELDRTVPEGLNYDENGELVAVYYYHGTDAAELTLAFYQYLHDLTTTGSADRTPLDALHQVGIGYALTSAAYGGAWPDLFAGHEDLWHQHWGSCLDNLEYGLMTADPTHVPTYNENMTVPECYARESATLQGWVAAFNMLHLWMYKLNPCGLFAGEHPEVAAEYPSAETAMYRPTYEWFETMGMEHLYPYGDADPGH